jgi:ribose 5-phosphate isomerase A
VVNDPFDDRVLAEKKQVAEEGARLVDDHHRIGLGSGSTVALLIEALARRRSHATFAAASPTTEQHARRLGLRVQPLDTLGPLDLALDGADQVDEQGWLVKGGGRAQTRERIVAAAADRFVVLVSSDKLVESVRPPIPIEILAFAHETTLRLLGDARLREPVLPTPGRGLIADLFDDFDDPRTHAQRLAAAPGVVSHGLFAPEEVDDVIVAGREAHRA